LFKEIEPPLRGLLREFMKITVLDGYTLNPGDLSWDEFKALGETQVFDRTPEDQIIQRSRGSQILLTNKAELKRDSIRQLADLKYIGILATGTNVVDLAAAREAGVLVTNVPAYGTASVAQATIALLLELTNGVGQHAESVHAGGWGRNPDWCYWDRPLVEVSGLTIGIIGFGRIGGAVAEIAAALGMKVAAFNAKAKPTPQFVESVDLVTLLRKSDVVSLHCPLTPQTERLINAERLSWMKPGAILLNTSRGGLLDEQAVADALNEGRLGGAGLDVLSKEPPPPNHPLLHAKNCIITPHQAWATRAARERLMKVAVENVRAFLAGKPQNVVS
jgi:glycerate dehydrogenase